MASFIKLPLFLLALAHKKHNLGSDSLVLWLSNADPTASADTLSDVTQITYTNLSSRAITVTSSAMDGSEYELILQDLVLTASGAVGPFRYVGVYNDTATNDDLVGGYYDYGSSISLASGETFTVDFNATDGFFGLA